MEDFFDTDKKFEIKIFQVNKAFYEFREYTTNEQIIQHIVDDHRSKIENNNEVGTPVPSRVENDVTYYTYVYNEDEKESHWTSFLPSELVAQNNFIIQQLSLVLFAVVDTQIFLFIGGTGIRAILRFINHRFGIELYEFIADPNEDIVNFITVRGISGNLSQQKNNYAFGHKLIDALTFTNIPISINIILRQDLKDTLFDFLNLGNEKVNLEIASYFCLKVKVDFSDLHEVFKVLSQILSSQFHQPLTSFVHIKDTFITENTYRFELYHRLKTDMYDRLIPTSAVVPPKFDIDFVHPSRLQEFYQCDRYELISRNSKLPFAILTDKNKIYIEALKWLLDNHPGFDFNYALSGIRVKGFRNNVQQTNAMFTMHLTCEISVQNQPVFLIDNNWYQVKNNFIDTINRTCGGMLNLNYLRDNILTIPWPDGITETRYNTLYEDIPNYINFDTITPQGIELCDIFYEDDSSIYLIHVKDGFDGQLRALGNQVVISATRFWTDKASGEYQHVQAVVNQYNNKPKNQNRQIDLDILIQSFNTKDIYYVMAFRSSLSNQRDIRNDIDSLRSNIAKYALIQCVRDMNSNTYPIKIYDIKR